MGTPLAYSVIGTVPSLHGLPIQRLPYPKLGKRMKMACVPAFLPVHKAGSHHAKS